MLLNYQYTKIYFISGGSGSGKTAIIAELKKLLAKEIVFHDFDDIGVPKNPYKIWRQEATEKWLKKILQARKVTCLLGQIVLGELLACPSASSLNNIDFYFLDVDDNERLKRLQKRPNFKLDQNILNWASWLRIHHQNPGWC